MAFTRKILKTTGLGSLLTQPSSFVEKGLTVYYFKAIPIRSDIIVPKSSIFKKFPRGDIRMKGMPAGIRSTFFYNVRFSHTDLQVPNFNDYRRQSVKDAEQSSFDNSYKRRFESYMVTSIGTMGGVYFGKVTTVEMVRVMSATADVLAVAQIEIKLAEIPVGKNYTVKWRGKPLFVRHRTPEQIAKERAQDLSVLRDPAPDEQMAVRPEWLVVIGVCTHLGCVPIADAGDYGGYYCPCHGSHYDYAGRIRRGPAPTNLEIPPHVFLDDNNLLVG